MNDLLLFQIIGWLYLLIGAGILLNPNAYKKMFEAYTTNRSMLFLSGMIAFVIGFLLVQDRYTLTGSWETIVMTAISWIILVKGALLVAFPGLGGWMSQKTHVLRHLVLVGSIIACAGIAFLWIGY